MYSVPECVTGISRNFDILKKAWPERKHSPELQGHQATTMKVRMEMSGKRRAPAAYNVPDPKVVKECAMELRNIGDLFNVLQLMLNTVSKMFQRSTWTPKSKLQRMAGKSVSVFSNCCRLGRNSCLNMPAKRADCIVNGDQVIEWGSGEINTLRVCF